MGIGLDPQQVQAPRWALHHVVLFAVWVLAHEARKAIRKRWMR